jgi:hypothetical protein
MSEPATKRLWCRFLLLTLLATTVASDWLAREISLIRERKAFLTHAREPFQSFRQSRTKSPMIKMAVIPFWRQWLGDHAVTLLMLPAGSTEAQRHRASVLFPEAVISVDHGAFLVPVAASLDPLLTHSRGDWRCQQELPT